MNESRSVREKVRAVSKGVKRKVLPKEHKDENPASAEALHQTIAFLAYQRAESRGFAPGHELEDWLQAESEVLAEREGLKGFPA